MFLNFHVILVCYFRRMVCRPHCTHQSTWRELSRFVFRLLSFFFVGEHKFCVFVLYRETCFYLKMHPNVSGNGVLPDPLWPTRPITGWREITRWKGRGGKEVDWKGRKEGVKGEGSSTRGSKFYLPSPPPFQFFPCQWQVVIPTLPPWLSPLIPAIGERCKHASGSGLRQTHLCALWRQKHISWYTTYTRYITENNNCNAESQHKCACLSIVPVIIFVLESKI